MNRPLGDREKAMVAAARLAAHCGDAAKRAGADESEVHSNRNRRGQRPNKVRLTSFLLTSCCSATTLEADRMGRRVERPSS